MLLLQVALCVLVENGRGGGHVQLFHQLGIGIELGLNVSRDFGQGLEATGLAGFFVFVQGLLRVLGGQQGGRFGRAVFADLQ